MSIHYRGAVEIYMQLPFKAREYAIVPKPSSFVSAISAEMRGIYGVTIKYVPFRLKL